MNWNRSHALVGVGALVLGLVFVGGATTITSHAGYSGVGPNFLPWVVGLALLLCGAALLAQARRGGFDGVDGAVASARADWSLRAWFADAAIGAAIAAPVFWMFTKLLAINLPGLTRSGWL